MKKIKFKFLFLCTCTLLVLNSCTIQKRTHRIGYYIDWHKKSTNIVRQKSIEKADFVATTDDKINLPKKEALNFVSLPAEVCGDTLFLLNGTKIICTVIEINEESIKYKQCENIDGPTYSTDKKSILKIVYLNGTTELISTISADNASNTVSNNHANSCSDTLFYKDGKIMACEIVELKSDYIKYKKCDSLNRAEYYVDRYKVKRFVNSGAIAQSKPLENHSTSKQQLSREVNPFSLMAFFSSLVSSGLVLRSIFASIAMSFSLSFIFFLLALILGIIGLVQISNNKQKYSGIALSVLAFIFPILAFLGGFLVYVFFFFWLI